MPPPSIPPVNNPYLAPPGTGSIPPTNNNPYAQNQTLGRAQTAPSPASIPPQNNPLGSQPPQSVSPETVQRRASAPPAARAPTPQPSVSMPKKQASSTRWGVVIFVLAIDVGLAAAGAWMLRAGLST